MPRLGDWFDLRAGHRRVLHLALDEPLAGGASFAYTFGSILVFLLLLQITTGIFLAMGYSASATDAWSSVAYIQDQVTLGWFVRGLHSHGASAMVIIAGVHLLQTAVYGAYRKPRELNWIVGVLMLGLLLAFALTGYLLPWDQTGFWATKVATGIAGSSPVIGTQLQEAVQGGNEYGNLTLTRFFGLHVLVLPGALIGLVVVHVLLFRKHGHTPHWWLKEDELRRRSQPFWPDQMFRDMVAMAAVFAVLVVVNLYTGGVQLDAPADPSSSFDARPEWYFRPLFQALKYFTGSMEQIVALGAPVVIGGVLLALPFVDRGPSNSPVRRWKELAALGLLGVVLGGLMVISFLEDKSDERYQKAVAESEERAREARTLALEHGVPTAGGPTVYTTARFFRARAIWREDCAGCHEGRERKGPEIGPGYNSRAWVRDFLKNPSDKRFFGVTGINEMKPVKQEGADLDALVELVYSQTGAADANPALVERGKALFDGDGNCSNCHSIDGKTEEEQGPNLGGRGSAEVLTEFIARPDHPRWFGKANEMPTFYNKYGGLERRELAEWLISLRGGHAQR
ncbi:MAG TPA: cytochrome b N-terminal domain-containing protein [Kofleriaceae bacterium]|nr:cytochrome b N-terminal domain-containing protein [Kofleriaceae bacterium]